MKVLLIADIHRDANAILYLANLMMDKYGLTAEDMRKEDVRFLILGDVGANYYLNELDSPFKKTLSELPFTYICLRGNHEARVSDAINSNPDAWDTIEEYGGEVYVEKNYPNIHYLSDIPAVYYFDGVKTLSIPGAYSLDKGLREEWSPNKVFNRGDKIWFPNELLTEEEMQYGRELISREESFDLVITHTCPAINMPYDLFLKGYDQTSVDTSMEEYLGSIEISLDYQRWVWGHFHANRIITKQRGQDRNKQMLMIACDKPVDLHKFMEMTLCTSFEEILV